MASWSIRNGAIRPNRIIIDTGIGFGKTSRHNIQILQNLESFHKLGFKVLINVWPDIVYFK